MKFRTDFVTNSSSSGFIAVAIKLKDGTTSEFSFYEPNDEAISTSLLGGTIKKITEELEESAFQGFNENISRFLNAESIDNLISFLDIDKDYLKHTDARNTINELHTFLRSNAKSVDNLKTISWLSGEEEWEPKDGNSGEVIDSIHIDFDKHAISWGYGGMDSCETYKIR